MVVGDGERSDMRRLEVGGWMLMWLSWDVAAVRGAHRLCQAEAHRRKHPDRLGTRDRRRRRQRDLQGWGWEGCGGERHKPLH
jgi:hypothetical protein